MLLKLTPAVGFPFRFPKNSEIRECRKSFQIRDIVKKNTTSLEKVCSMQVKYVWTVLSESDLGTCLCTRYISVTAQGKYSLSSSGLQISVWCSHRIWFMIIFSRQLEWPKTLFTKTGFKQGAREDYQENVRRDLGKRKSLRWMFESQVERIFNWNFTSVLDWVINKIKVDTQLFLK